MDIPFYLKVAAPVLALFRLPDDADIDKADTEASAIVPYS
jgi:hypothetical protein